MSKVVLSIDQCLKNAEGVIECTKEKVKLARSTQSRRNAKFTIEFFEAMVYHLRCLKELKETKVHVVDDSTGV